MSSRAGINLPSGLVEVLKDGDEFFTSRELTAEALAEVKRLIKAADFASSKNREYKSTNKCAGCGTEMGAFEGVVVLCEKCGPNLHGEA